MKRLKLPPASQAAIYWLTAVGLHAGLLLLPIASSESPLPVSEKPVKVVQAPRLTPRSPVAQRSAQPSTAAPPSAKPVVPPMVTRSPALVVKSSPQPSPTPQPTSTPTSDTPSPAPSSSSPSSSPSPSPSSTPSPTPSPALPDSLGDSSKSLGASQNCGADQANCWQAADSDYRSVAQKLATELVTKGYQVEVVDLEEDTGMQVRRVSKGDKFEYYLYFLSADGTVYFRDAGEVVLSQAAAKQKAGV